LIGYVANMLKKRLQSKELAIRMIFYI